MNKTILFLIAGCSFLFNFHSSSAQAPFITTWQFYSDNEQLTIPTAGGGYSYTVNWGDGTIDNTVYTGNATHTYSNAGTYAVSISGSFPTLYFRQTMVRTVEQWGDIHWQSLAGAFSGCSFLSINATDAPDLSAVTDLSEMFYGCSSMNNPDFSGWDVSHITTLNSMFQYSHFDGDLSTWDVSNVTEMSYLFYGSSFNGNIGNWNTANVTSMFAMFYDNTAFNGDISNWNTSKVTIMDSMFKGASSFNQDLGSWDISQSTNMGSFFSGTALSLVNYSSTLTGWATLSAGETKIPTNLTLDAGILMYCDDAGRNILTDTYGWNIFDGGIAHPKPDQAQLPPVISEGPVSSLTIPTAVDECTSALIVATTDATFPITTSQFVTWTYTNQLALTTEQQQFIYIGHPFITTWQTLSDNEQITIPTEGGGYIYVVNWGDGTTDNTTYTGSATHVYATAGIHTVSIAGSFPRIYFNDSGSKNNILSVQQWGDIAWGSMQQAFQGCANLTIDATDAPDLQAVATMESMFLNTTDLGNVDLSGWDVSHVTNMSLMFDGSGFNGNISTWDVSHVTTMYDMFGHSHFNGDISTWDVSGVSDLSYMFYWSQFNGDLSAWDVSGVTNMSNLFAHSPFAGDVSSWDVSHVTSMYALFSYTPFNGDLSAWDVSNVTNMTYIFYWAQFNGSLSDWDISSATDMSWMFAQSRLSQQNYENTLTGWATLVAGETKIPSGITLGADGLYYCDATAHNTLINSHGWSIVNDSKNCAPMLAPIGNQTTDEDTELTFNVSATDTESAPETLTFGLDANSYDKGMALSALGEFSWTPTNDHVGMHQVTVTVSDGILSESKTFTISVNGVNDPPVLASIGNKLANEDEMLSFTAAVTDVDNSTLTLSLDATSSGKGMTLSPAGDFSWTPIADDVDVHTVTITASDGTLMDSETFTITVNAVNDAPVLASIGDKQVSEDATLAFAVAATDEDDTMLTFSLDATSSSKGMTLSSTGAFSWVPANEHVGTHEVTITVSDGLLTDSETITITVDAVNDAPVLTSIGDKQVDEDATLAFAVSVTDEDNSLFIFSLDQLSSAKGMSLSSAGGFSWAPGIDDVGIHQVTVTVSDGVLTDSETITITVNAVNDAPLLTAIGNKQVKEDATLTFTALATDEDNTTLTFSLDATSSSTGMTLSSSGGFSWTPDHNDVGTHETTITVSDGLLTDSETIIITVNDVNDAPVLAAIGNKKVNEEAALAFTVSATDADNQLLTFSLDAASSGKGMTLTSSGEFHWSPTSEQVGEHNVTITVSDGELTDSETFAITVSSLNHAPVLAAVGNREANEDESFSFAVSATDVDGQPLVYSLDEISSGKGMTLTSSGEFSWTPDQAQVGDHAVTITVSDGELEDSEMFTLTVHAVNDVPLVEANGGLTLSQSARGTITSAMLRATDEDNSAGEITFTVKTLPADGTLLIDEVPIAVNGTFTQLDVDQNKISYQNNGTSHATDAFSFTVSDGHGGVISLVTFSIHIDITTAVETAPEVEFGIYPVPASEALNIKMVSDYRGAVNIRLIDLTGREMVNDDLVKSDAALNHSIDVSSISPGLLFLKITTTRYTRTLKLLKK